MEKLKEYINSGILELYVLGLTSVEENTEVKKMSLSYPEIAAEIDEISQALIIYSEKTSAPLDPTIKPFVLATINYMERMKNGEEPTFPPLLKEGVTVSDFDPWLNRSDMVLDGELKDFQAKLIGYTPEMITGIVWIKQATPYETHKTIYENFLIVEGTCDIVTDTGTHSLKPGDYYSIQLNLGHVVKVTSKTPCKAILQRVAA